MALGEGEGYRPLPPAIEKFNVAITHRAHSDGLRAPAARVSV